MAILAIMQILALELALGLRERDRAIRQGKFLCCFSLADRQATTEWKKGEVRGGNSTTSRQVPCPFERLFSLGKFAYNKQNKTTRKTQSKEKPKVVRKLYAKFT